MTATNSLEQCVDEYPEDVLDWELDRFLQFHDRHDLRPWAGNFNRHLGKDYGTLNTVGDAVCMADGAVPDERYKQFFTAVQELVPKTEEEIARRKNTVRQARPRTVPLTTQTTIDHKMAPAVQQTKPALVYTPRKKFDPSTRKREARKRNIQANKALFDIVGIPYDSDESPIFSSTVELKMDLLRMFFAAVYGSVDVRKNTRPETVLQRAKDFVAKYGTEELIYILSRNGKKSLISYLQSKKQTLLMAYGNYKLSEKPDAAQENENSGALEERVIQTEHLDVSTEENVEFLGAIGLPQNKRSYSSKILGYPVKDKLERLKHFFETVFGMQTLPASVTELTKAFLATYGSNTGRTGNCGRETVLDILRQPTKEAAIAYVHANREHVLGYIGTTPQTQASALPASTSGQSS